MSMNISKDILVGAVYKTPYKNRYYQLCKVDSKYIFISLTEGNLGVNNSTLLCYDSLLLCLLEKTYILEYRNFHKFYLKHKIGKIDKVLYGDVNV